MKVDHLVIDAGGFLRNANLRELGHKLYTCREVVAEIKDKATRQRLSVLPFELHYQDPSSKSIQAVTEASKKSGDYASLSHTDLKVLALAHELTIKYEGTEVSNESLEKRDIIQLGRSDNLKIDLQLPGFYLPSAQEIVTEEKEFDNDGNCNSGDLVTNFSKIELNSENVGVIYSNYDQSQAVEPVQNSEDEVAEPEENSDEGGWITPAMLREMKNDEAENSLDIKVACVTTDFAMQNVMLKMKMHIVSVDGMLIKTMRNYVLRCHACFEITKVMTKVFCPKCGNKTLKRVPVEVQKDGSMKLFFSRNPKVLNPRGLRYSLPKPQGGKHSHNPILCEDQVLPHDRPSRKALLKTNVWGEDYDNASSPFIMNDTESRAFRLGVRPGNNRNTRRNPNAVGKKFVKRR